MAQSTSETNGVSALLDEVEEAIGSMRRPDGEAMYATPARARHVAVAYVLGRRGMPLSEVPRVLHLLELRERGHAV